MAPADNSSSSARLPLIIGFASVLLLIGGLGAWGIGTQISGAVIAPGVVEVETDLQVVQHPDGGVVGEILVRDGDAVAAGDVLVRFDGTFMESERLVVRQQLLELRARQARLTAERDRLDAPDFSAVGTGTGLNPDWVASQIAGQKNLFQARQTSLQQQVQQLEEQQRQIETQITGTEAQLAALDRQLALIRREARDLGTLLERQLVPAARVLELQREEARLEGEIGRLTAFVAEARGRIAALAIEVLRLADARREEAITTLRDLRYSEIELDERRRRLEEQLSRLEVRAPMSGTVFGSQVLALQSVVRPADPMMHVVPRDRPLLISAQVDPIHIDQVFPGQPVSLRFTTFDQRLTPEIEGRVLRLSADTVADQTTGLEFYEATLLPDANALAEMPSLELLPGMPVEAFIRTREQTPLAYLARPLSIYFSRALREE